MKHNLHIALECLEFWKTTTCVCPMINKSLKMKKKKINWYVFWQFSTRKHTSLSFFSPYFANFKDCKFWKTTTGVFPMIYKGLKMEKKINWYVNEWKIVKLIISEEREKKAGKRKLQVINIDCNFSLTLRNF